MIVDFASVLPWVSGLISIITLLTLLKNILSSGEKELGVRLKAVETKLIEHDRRVQTIEGEMKHLPDRDAQHRMELQLAEMNGKFAALEERLRPIAQVSIRLQEFMLEQANK